jgi:hypothetical protein
MPPILRHCSVVVADPRHRAVRLVAGGTTLQYHLSSGTREHATIVWVPVGSFDHLADTRRNKRKVGTRRI